MFLEKIPVRFRLSLGHGIWMAILFLGIGVSVYKFVEVNLYQSVDAALVASAKSIRKSRAAINYRSPFTQSFLREFFGENFIRPYAQMVDLSGKVSARTENVTNVNLPVTPLAAARAEKGWETIENISTQKIGPLRLITLPIMHRGRFTGELIQVGAPLETTRHTLRSVSLMLWIAMPVSLGLSIIFGYFLTAWSLKPVRSVTRAAAKLSGEDLQVRLPLPLANDEICDLTKTFNGMLDRLQDAFYRIRRFAGDVSHELRTPLAVLRGEAELALRRPRSEAEYKQSLEIIAKESVHMTAIVEDLLLLARAQSNSVAMTWDTISVDEMVDSLLLSVQSIYQNKKIQLEYHPKEKGLTFIGSANYLGLALKNILLNALKHSPEGSTVQLKVAKVKQQIEFRIQDQGEGIPSQALPYIFDAFFRADTARNRSAGGSGIGLSLALALIKLHQGVIEVDSQEKVGSTFTIRIPCDQDQLKRALETHRIKDQERKKALTAENQASLSKPFH